MCGSYNDAPRKVGATQARSSTLQGPATGAHAAPVPAQHHSLVGPFSTKTDLVSDERTSQTSIFDLGTGKIVLEAYIRWMSERELGMDPKKVEDLIRRVPGTSSDDLAKARAISGEAMVVAQANAQVVVNALNAYLGYDASARI